MDLFIFKFFVVASFDYNNLYLFYLEDVGDPYIVNSFGNIYLLTLFELIITNSQILTPKTDRSC